MNKGLCKGTRAQSAGVSVVFGGTSRGVVSLSSVAPVVGGGGGDNKSAVDADESGDIEKSL